MKSKIMKFYQCVSSPCVSCLNFLFKSNRGEKSPAQNYISLPAPLNGNLDAKIAHLDSQSMIETTPLPSTLMPENGLLAKKPSFEKTKVYGETDFEKEIERNSAQIIEEMYEKSIASYDDWEKTCDEPAKPHKLKLYLKSYVKENRNRVNIMRLEYIAPCSAKELIQFQNSVEESRKMIAKNLDSLEVFREYGPENCYKLMHSKYKKILTASPRDFVYMKHFRQIEKNGKIYWVEISHSIDAETHPVTPQFIRGDVILSGQIAEDINDKECFVRTWIEVDFRISLPLFLMKTASTMEMKSWIDKCDERLREINFEKEKKTDKV